jgi:Tfp pilus assembly protein PilF
MKHTMKLPMPATRYLASLLAAAIMLSGCAAIKEIENPFKQETAEEAAAKAALSGGIALYEHGEYTAAVRKLATSGEIWKADKDLQLQALKYMAFSYCVTSQPAPCRQQFDKALKLDPAFDLTSGEKGHPLWGPVFERAKKQK